MDAVRKKRSHDGTSAERRKELEVQLAALRDQEAVLIRAIELAQSYVPQQQAAAPAAPRPRADNKHLSTRRKQIQEEQSRRATAIWEDVRGILKALSNLKEINTLFGKPVSESFSSNKQFMEHYNSIIKKPMDLKTIKAKLGEGKKARQYHTPMEVANDVRLIVDNCLTFNSNDPSGRYCNIALDLKQKFASKMADKRIELRWHEEMKTQKQEEQEIKDLEAAVSGTVPDKIVYFNNCIKRRLSAMQVPPPAQGTPFTWEQKRKLSLACTSLSAQQCYGLIEIVANSANSGEIEAPADGEVVLGIDTLPDSVLWKLQNFVNSLPAQAQAKAQPAEKPEPHAAAPAKAAPAEPAPTPVGPKPEPPAVANGKAHAAEAAPKTPEEPAAAEPAADEAAAAPASKPVEQAPSADKAGSDSDSSSSSSSDSDSGSGSSSDDDEAAANQPDGGMNSNKSTASADDAAKGKESPRSDNDSKQGESHHGDTGNGKDSPNKNSGENGTALVSRNIAPDDKPAPTILPAQQHDFIPDKIDNADLWDVPEEDPMDDDNKGDDENDGQAAADEPVDPEWARACAEGKREEEKRQRALDEEKAAEAARAEKRKLEETQAANEEAEQAERERKRMRELEEQERDPGDTDEDLDMAP